MAEYIERDAARAELIINDELYAADIVKAIPAADAVEVIHAYWVWDGYDYEKPWACSKCRYHSENETNYCPNCGARMDGGVNDAADN